MKKIALFVGIIFVVACFASCGDKDENEASCKSICEATKDCGNDTDEDCDTMCEQLEEIVEKAECENQFDLMLKCLDDLEDVCDEEDCDLKTKGFGACVADYCLENFDECDDLDF